jgi:methylmalonyl-CoA mutase N-terminal domain/subunit
VSTDERPGEFPFTRGDSVDGPDPQKWFSTYYSGAGTSSDTNALFRDRFMGADGTPSLLLAMDLPTQVGLDPDHPLSSGEVGKIGVAVSSLDDIRALFDGIPLDSVISGTVGNSIGAWTCPLFVLAGETTGVTPDRMRIVLQNDPIKEFTGRGTQIFSPEVAIEMAADVVEFAHHTLGATWKPQYTCSTQMRWGGVSAAQEIGFGLASMMTYVRAAERRGVAPGSYLSRTDLHMSSDENLIDEVAKFRAARRAWAYIVRDHFGQAVADVSPLKITVFTAGNRLTAQRPLNNIVRTTTHVLAAMLGGVHEMLVPGYDEALGLPTREATSLTNATKQILFHETGIGSVVDALGGSDELERRTTEMADEARHWFEVVQEAGGMLGAIENRLIWEHMTNGTYDRQLEIESGERKIVGLNHGDTAAAPDLELFEGNPKAEGDQLLRVQNLREDRDPAEVGRALSALGAAAARKRDDLRHNLILDVKSAIAARASVGEIYDVLRNELGQSDSTLNSPRKAAVS